MKRNLFVVITGDPEAFWKLNPESFKLRDIVAKYAEMIEGKPLTNICRIQACQQDFIVRIKKRSCVLLFYQKEVNKLNVNIICQR